MKSEGVERTAKHDFDYCEDLKKRGKTRAQFVEKQKMSSDPIICLSR